MSEQIVITTPTSIKIINKSKRRKRAIIGYVRREDKLIRDRRHAPTIEQIFHMRANGYSYGMIAEMINSTGYKTPRGNKLTRQTIKSILSNERYLGDEDTTQLISNAIFKQIQEMKE